MIKKVKDLISGEGASELKNGRGKNVRDAIRTYLTGNSIENIGRDAEKVADIENIGRDAKKAADIENIGRAAEEIINIINDGTTLSCGTESAHALAKIVYKTSKDVARGDKVSTGLCILSATFESVALCYCFYCSTLGFTPFRSRIYRRAKKLVKDA